MSGPVFWICSMVFSFLGDELGSPSVYRTNARHFRNCFLMMRRFFLLMRKNLVVPLPIGQTPDFFGTVFDVPKSFLFIEGRNLVVPLPIGQTSAFFGTVFAACEKEIDILLLANYN